MGSTILRLSALALLATAVNSQIIAVDFGSDFIKVAGVKPGTGIDLVLNEQSKRKSNNYIGYRGDDRFLGEDAYNLAPRFPDQMYTFMNRLAGKSYADAEFREETFIKGFGLPYSFSEDPVRKTILINNPHPETTYSPEELIAQLLGYVKKQAEKHLEIDVTGSVITVPAFMTVAEREALVHAANLTGLPVLSLVSNTLAAALQYGVQRRGFGNQTTTVVIYDMGASRTEVGVYRFTEATEVNGKPKRGGELGNLETLAVTYDESLGGRAFTDCIADHLAKKFEEETGLSFAGKTDRASMKAQTVLLRVANKAKETLSANKQAPVHVEELYEGKPFFYTITRVEFEEIAAKLFERAAPPLLNALEKAGLKPEDLQAVEVVGGGIRVPALQTSLSEVLGGRTLDKTLNGDECMVLGAAFEAAKLSETFRTKGFTVTDYPSYNVSFKLSQLEGSEKPSKMRPLFSHSLVGSKKSITVSRTKDFDLSLFLEHAGQEPELLKTVSLQGIPDALDALGFNKEDKNASSTHSVQVQVRLTNEGLVEIDNAKVKYDEHVQVTKKIKIKEPKVNATNSTDSEDKKDEEKKDEEKKDEDKKDEEKKEEDKPQEEAKPEDAGEKKEDADKAGDEKADEKEEVKPEEPKYKYVNKTEIKKHRKDLTYAVQTVAPHPMGPADYERSVEVLKKLQDIEDVKRAAAAAKNDLETYMYWTKFEGVLDNEDMQEYITEENREAIVKALEEVSEWAEYGEGSEDSCTKDMYVEKKKVLEEVIGQVTDKKKAKDDEERKAKEAEHLAKRKAEEAEKKKAKEEKKKAEEEAASAEATEDDKEKPKEETKETGEEKSGSEL